MRPPASIAPHRRLAAIACLAAAVPATTATATAAARPETARTPTPAAAQAAEQVPQPAQVGAQARARAGSHVPAPHRQAASHEPAAPHTLVEREAFLMGTLLAARVEAPGRAAGIAAIEGAFREVRRLEGLLSTWRSDTELARLNAAPPGEPFTASPELLRLLLEARAWSARTAGAFDPAVGALVDAWDLRRRGRVPGPERLRGALEASGAGAFAFDEEAGTVTRLRAGAWLDSGGFGKGAALAAAELALKAAGVRSAILDFGGQVLALGTGADARGWPVPVAHPERRLEPAARLRLRDGSAATSAASERYVEVEGRHYGHVLDPRTGRPVPAWGSVTVVARDPLAADALSTALFVMGSEEALRWAGPRADVGVLVLTRTPAAGVAAAWNAALELSGVELAPGVERRGVAWARSPDGSRQP